MHNSGWCQRQQLGKPGEERILSPMQEEGGKNLNPPWRRALMVGAMAHPVERGHQRGDPSAGTMRQKKDQAWGEAGLEEEGRMEGT